MGGGHDHGHGPPYKVPDYRIYKVEDAPELLKVQQALAAQGLKSNWLRNEVWRYDPKIWGPLNSSKLWMDFTFRGFKWGLAAAVLTVAIEKAIDAVKGDDHGHGHGGHH